MSEKLKIMQEKKTKELNWMDKPVEADRWINLYFLKDGSTVKGTKVLDTEESAKKYSIECHKRALEKGNRTVFTQDRAKRWEDLSYTIQIPLKS